MFYVSKNQLFPKCKLLSLRVYAGSRPRVPQLFSKSLNLEVEVVFVFLSHKICNSVLIKFILNQKSTRLLCRLISMCWAKFKLFSQKLWADVGILGQQIINFLYVSHCNGKWNLQSPDIELWIFFFCFFSSEPRPFSFIIQVFSAINKYPSWHCFNVILHKLIYLYFYSVLCVFYLLWFSHSDLWI